jgi:periplasmic protein CpxP/Spy
MRMMQAEPTYRHKLRHGVDTSDRVHEPAFFQEISMSQSRYLLPSIFLATSLSLFTLPASADLGCGPMQGQGVYSDYGAERMAQRQQKLHAALKLDSTQESAWKSLLGSEHGMRRPNARNIDGWARLTTPERAERMQESMQSRQQAMSEHLIVLKAFYNGLNAEQKKTFDDFHVAPNHRLRAKPMPQAPRAAVTTP